MKKELARDILDLLDSPKHVDTLAAYAEQEIQQCQTNLEGCNDMVSVARQQGAISALKQLMKLRDTAIRTVENDGKASNSTTGSR